LSSHTPSWALSHAHLGCSFQCLSGCSALGTAAASISFSFFADLRPTVTSCAAAHTISSASTTCVPAHLSWRFTIQVGRLVLANGVASGNLALQPRSSSSSTSWSSWSCVPFPLHPHAPQNRRQASLYHLVPDACSSCSFSSCPSCRFLRMCLRSRQGVHVLLLSAQVQAPPWHPLRHHGAHVPLHWAQTPDMAVSSLLVDRLSACPRASRPPATLQGIALWSAIAVQMRYGRCTARQSSHPAAGGKMHLSTSKCAHQRPPAHLGSSCGRAARPARCPCAPARPGSTRARCRARAACARRPAAPAAGARSSAASAPPAPRRAPPRRCLCAAPCTSKSRLLRV
jgi:hypothetical protein